MTCMSRPTSLVDYVQYLGFFVAVAYLASH